MADDDKTQSLDAHGDDDKKDDSTHNGGHSSSKSSYRQKYKHAWELDPELKGWLTACSSDAYAAYCRFCRTKLHAHKKGLLAHSRSAKHKKHVAEPNFQADSFMPNDSFGPDPNGDSESNGDIDDHESKRIKRSHKGQYLFNDNWLRDPSFSPWIRRIMTNNTKAFCAACRCIVTAGRCELVKHSRAAKHKKAIDEGKPFEEPTDIELHWLEVSCNQDQGNHMNSTMMTYDDQQANLRSASFMEAPGLYVDEILNRLNNYVPLSLAESWDNVGVITKPTQPIKVHNILITIDLNERIVEEAIRKRAQFIISYHPPIFAAIKSLNPKKWKDKAILMCIEHRITVYSPHTALDAIKGGINDWLISALMSIDEPLKYKVKPVQHSSNKQNTSCFEVLLSETPETVAEAFKNIHNVTITEYGNTSKVRVMCDDNTLPEVIEHLAQQKYTPVCTKVTKLVADPIPGVGLGRFVTFTNPLPLYEIVQRTKTHLGLSHIRLALSPMHTRDTKVESVACCAGSGSSVLKGCPAVVWITGEMSHHEILDAINTGVTVLLCEHSNTERGFLRDWSLQLSSSVFEHDVFVEVSELDKEPLRIV